MKEETKKAIGEAVAKEVSPLVEALKEKKEKKAPAKVKAVPVTKEKKLVGFVDYVLTAGRKQYDKAEQIAKSVNLATNAAGGYLAPEEWMKEVSRVVEDYGVARKLGRLFPMQYQTVNVPKKNAGATAYWPASGAAITESSPTFATTSLVAKKLAALVSIDNTMLGSAVDINMVNYIRDMMAEAIAFQEDTEVLNGDGSAPAIDGIFQDSNVTEVDMSTGDTSFDDVSYDYLNQLLHAIPHQHRAGAKWVMNDAVLGRVERIKTSTGEPIYRDMSEGKKSTLFGHEIVVSSIAPSTDAVSTAFIAFGNFDKGALFGLHKDMTLAVSDQYNFNSDMLTLRAVELLDYEIVQPSLIARLVTAAS